MIKKQNLKPFIFAICLHILLFAGISIKTPPKNFKVAQKQTEQLKITANNEPQKVEPIKAVSVDKELVEQTINKLKNDRLAQQKKEEAQQLKLKKQAELARKQRQLEQERINKLKAEAEKLKKEQAKKLLAEKQRLQELQKQKKEQEQKLSELKKRQQEEAKTLAEINKQKQEAKAKQEELARLKEQREKELARIEAQKQERIKGEVNKYKALIISAISRQWILPENIDSNLSSQFRIELAPNGSVLNVELIKTSGDAILDRSAQAAIYKASPLPVPADEDAFKVFKNISLTVRPQNARG